MGTNIGIIGFGGFGRFLYDSFEQMPKVKVTAIADIKKSLNPGNTKFYTAWQDLIRDDEIDMVWVATAPDTHAKMACDAMYAGKDVIIEKPIATNVKDAKQIIKVRDNTGKLVTVNYMMRFNPICKCLADFTHENIFGKLRRVNVENYAQDETLPLQHWFWNKKASGGILIEHAVHFIDLVNYISGQEYRTVNGLSYKRKTGQEDQVFATVLYDEGLIASHYHSFSRPRFFERTTIRLSYDLAEIDIEGWIPLKGYFRTLVNKETFTALKRLPNVEIKKETKISSIIKAFNLKQAYTLRSGGIKYNADKMVEGTFEIKEEKQHVYAVCVRALLTDFLAKRENPKHKLRVSLEDGLSSLTIADMASKAAI
jgi:predicted dehydrogenase